MSAKPWQPLEVEPDPVELARCATSFAANPAGRDRAGSRPPIPTACAAPSCPMARMVRRRSAANPRRRSSTASARALSYAVVGNAVVDQRSLRFLARAILDRQTRAFLDISLDLQTI